MSTTTSLSEITDDEFPDFLSDFAATHVTSQATVPSSILASKEIFLRRICQVLHSESKSSPKLVHDALVSLRALSRDKRKLEILIEKNDLHIKGGDPAIDHIVLITKDDINYPMKTRIEAMKVLCNAAFLSDPIAQYLVRSNCRIIDELVTVTVPPPLTVFSVRLAFLLTAKISKTRHAVFSVSIFENSRNLLEKSCDKSANNADRWSLACDLLKFLYNLVCDGCPALKSKHSSEHSKSKLLDSLTRLARLMCECFPEVERIWPSSSKDKAVELSSHFCSVISTLPLASIIPAVMGDNDGDNTNEKEHMIVCCGAFLDHIEFCCVSKATVQDLVPALTLMTRLAKARNQIRKFCRKRVLPPLQASDVQPTESPQTFRSKLLQHLVSPHFAIQHSIGRFLFVLCKEDSDTFVKFTGFGNAAGLLANIGLIKLGAGTKGDQPGATIREVENAEEDSFSDRYCDYSSGEEEDIATDSYKDVEHLVNPVTGKIEDATAKATSNNPLDGMSDEQKEYEIHELMTLMHRLEDQGVIKATGTASNEPLPLRELVHKTAASKKFDDDENTANGKDDEA